MMSQEPTNCSDKLRQFDIQTSTLVNSVYDEEFRAEIMDNVFKQSTIENPHIRNVKYSTDICTELKEDQRKKFVEEKRRQQLRANNEELKKLEQQIRAGYVMRTVQAQIFEKEALAKNLKVIEDAESNRLLMAQMKLQDVVTEEQLKAKKEELKNELAEQIAQKKELHRNKYQELIKERQIMEDSIKKYKAEIEAEMCKEREKVAKTRKDLDDYVQAKTQYGMEQDQAWEEEQKRYKQLLTIREQERQKVREATRKKIMQKELISEKIGKHIHAIEVEKAKKRDLLADLLCDEREAKDALQMKEHLQKQCQNKMLTLKEMEQMQIRKEEERLHQKKAEEAYFQDQMRILAEQHKLEQLSDEKRRRKQMEHRRALQDAFNNQKMGKAEEISVMIRTREELVKEEERREQLVRDERIRMLKEHAHILKYCAPGVIRDSEKIILKEDTDELQINKNFE